MASIKEFPPRLAFVTKHPQSGELILTREAFAFLRDTISSLSASTETTDIFSQFAEVDEVVKVGVKEPAITEIENYGAKLTELERRIDNLSNLFAMVPDATALLTELERRIDNLSNLFAMVPDATALISETVKGGSYTPTLYNTTNVAASTAYTTSFVRVGKNVIVWGQLDIDITTASSNTDLGISLPIPSDFTSLNSCSGIGGGVYNNHFGVISADITNNRAIYRENAATTTDRQVFFNFFYQIV